MATTNPSYYRSGVCQAIMQKEHLFHLYMNQHWAGSKAEINQKGVVAADVPRGFGTTIVNDWTVSDGHAPDANIVGQARGMHISDGKDNENWLLCHSIMFTDSRFKGSSLKVLGDFEANTGSEWAIVGGTGEFACAEGVVTFKIIENLISTTGRIFELRIRAFCRCISEMTKTGPWGGVGGKFCDIPGPPQSLQTVMIGYGDLIYSIAFSYTDKAGQEKAAGPWGGSNCELTRTITLAPSEIIKQVIVTIGAFGGETVVTSLTLVSNLSIYGPFGKASGTTFCSQVQDCKTVAGFFAHAGATVNALGVYYA